MGASNRGVGYFHCPWSGSTLYSGQRLGKYVGRRVFGGCKGVGGGSLNGRREYALW